MAQTWVEVTSPHFTVMTDAGATQGYEVARQFEQMRAVFGTLVLKDKVNISAPMEIIGFRDNQETKAYVPLFNGKPVQASGFALMSQDRYFVALDLSAHNHWSAVFHEYAHALLNSNLPEMPAWFDEGIAEFYSTIRIDNKDVLIGGPPEGAATSLTRNRLAPVEELFAVDHSSAVYNETGNHRTFFYAQSWLLVHYLLDKHMIDRVNTYAAALKQKLSIGDAVQQAFGMSTAQLDKALRDYLHSGRVKAYIYAAPPEIDTFTYRTATLGPLEARAALADLHGHSRDYQDKAISEFESILSVQPEHEVAHRGLGFVFLLQGRFDKAADHFQRASSQNVKDPMAHYYAAMLTLTRQTGASPQELARARKSLEAATALNPDYAEAFAALGRASASAGDYSAAIPAMKRATELSPREEFYAYDLAGFYIHESQWDPALAMLLRLQGTTNPVIAPYIDENVAMVRRRLPASAPAAQRPQ